MKSTQLISIFIGLIIAVAASGCRDKDRHGFNGNGGGGGPISRTFVVSQNNQNGDVSITLDNLSGTETSITVLGHERGASTGLFNSSVASVTTTVLSLPLVLDYVQHQLDKFDKIRVSGSVDGIPVPDHEFDLTRISGTKITISFPNGTMTDAWGFSMTRTATELLPIGADVQVTVNIRDANGVRMQPYLNRNLGGGANNGIVHGNPNLILGGAGADTEVEVIVGGPPFVAPTTRVFAVPADMGKTVSFDLFLSPN